MRSVFSCSVHDLVASSGKTDDENRRDNVWEIISDSPYYRSGGITTGGKLVVASGIDATGDVTTTVHSLDPINKKWTEVGEMPSARSSCSIALLPGDQILIAGGYFKPRNWIGSLTKDTMATVNLNIL
jgi:N-acetylneuraminic acid mutarotase